jgi:hypothetical protein
MVNCKATEEIEEDVEFTWTVQESKVKIAASEESTSWKRRRRRLKLKAVKKAEKMVE